MNQEICLDEFQIMAGNDFTLVKTIFDQDGLPFGLTNYTASMKIAEFGNIRTVVSTISGTISIPESTVTFVFPQATTNSWNGKYIYQIVLDNPTAGKTYSPKQGVFLVVERIN